MAFNRRIVYFCVLVIDIIVAVDATATIFCFTNDWRDTFYFRNVIEWFLIFLYLAQRHQAANIEISHIFSFYSEVYKNVNSQQNTTEGSLITRVVLLCWIPKDVSIQNNIFLNLRLIFTIFFSLFALLNWFFFHECHRMVLKIVSENWKYEFVSIIQFWHCWILLFFTLLNHNTSPYLIFENGTERKRVSRDRDRRYFVNIIFSGIWKLQFQTINQAITKHTMHKHSTHQPKYLYLNREKWIYVIWKRHIIHKHFQQNICIYRFAMLTYVIKW